MLPQLQAEQQVRSIEAASVPHMTSGGHREVMRGYQHILGGETRAARASSVDLAAMGIAVEYVGADGLPAREES
jgi:hypothetical protein